MNDIEIFVNCPKGIEGLLKDELSTLGANSVRETVAGVYAYGDKSLPYKICLWSRLANRVLLPLAKVEVNSADDLYAGAQSIQWSQHFSAETTFAVDFSGRSDEIRHSQFGAQRVKDAIVDQFQQVGLARPNVDLKTPDIRINAYLSKNKVALSLDLSGDSLHRRGYRVAMVPAPLKENLAAALLIRAGWPAICAANGALIDPMCGSGTLLIEAAMMAVDMAPGLHRQHYGFRYWQQFDRQCWQELRDDAQQRLDVGLASNVPEIRGYDKDSRAITATQENIDSLKLSAIIKVIAKPLQALKKPTHKTIDHGLLITNPPYGERWGEVDALRVLYEDLGRIAKSEFGGWRLALFTGNKDLASELRLRADKNYSLFNGTIAARLSLYSLRVLDNKTDNAKEATEPQQPKPLSESEAMLANRIRKNSKRLQGWLKKSKVSCYRLYDQDLPEYAVAIDVYDKAFHIQEYAPPATIDANKARQRLRDVKRVMQHLYPDQQQQLFFKERRRQSGDSQYQLLNPKNNATKGFVVNEAKAKIEVNLVDYLDSGLFLDHRPMREMIGSELDGKRFLNLFCYTAVATVHAVLGGAASSVSIDMSNTYLEWGERNFALNGFGKQTAQGKKHQLLRADCVEWLAKKEGQFDVIFLDPPTFSNSKKMTDVLDIQRDHPQLIDNAMAILAPGGTLIFSNNFRRFKMEDILTRRYDVEDISQETIPVDYQRSPKIHRCWLITHKEK